MQGVSCSCVPTSTMRPWLSTTRNKKKTVRGKADGHRGAHIERGGKNKSPDVVVTRFSHRRQMMHYHILFIVKFLSMFYLMQQTIRNPSAFDRIFAIIGVFKVFVRDGLHPHNLKCYALSDDVIGGIEHIL